MHAIITDMGQEINVQNNQPEYRPIQGSNVERNFENYGINSSEKKGDVLVSNSPAQNTSLPITLPEPVIDNGVVDDITTVVVGDNPLVASDDDLIEKEWVEKAKKIVSETHDDPYKQDEAVNQLQADYISKRYGRKLGA